MITNLNKDDNVEFTDPHTNQKVNLTYLGKGEVKEVLFDFFKNDSGETLFFYPSEVGKYMKVVKP